jgi:glyoxylase-like metal-dependent hydrolase (beta-lactamase superfamily II)
MSFLILKRSTHPVWRSNAYLVGDVDGGCCVLVDSGAPLDGLLDAAAVHGLQLRAVLTTHRHPDHVAGHAELIERTGCEVYALDGEASHVPAAQSVEDGFRFEWGRIRADVVALPGHTVGHAGYSIEDVGLFCGDSLFAGSTGSVCGAAATDFAEAKSTILDRILALPDTTALFPGHAGSTTVGHERVANPFVRLMTGLDPEGDEPCTALGRRARLVALARDYDGRSKAWVRFDDDGADAIVPGSVVEIRRGIPSSSAGLPPRRRFLIRESPTDES